MLVRARACAGMLEGMSSEDISFEDLALLFDRWQVLQLETQQAKDIFLDAVEVANSAGVSVRSIASFLGVTSTVVQTPLKRRRDKVK